MTSEEWRRCVPPEAVVVMGRMLGQVRRMRPRHDRARVLYQHVSADIVEGDVVRLWCDVYVRIYGDMLHGWVRFSGEWDGSCIRVTRWCRPRGQGWRPMFGAVGGPIEDELGWVYDITE